MRGRMAGMAGLLLTIAVLLFFSAAFWFGVVYSLRTGEANVKGRVYKRAEEPFEFWLAIAFGSAVALFTTGCVIRLLFSGEIDWHTGMWKRN